MPPMKKLRRGRSTSPPASAGIPPLITAERRDEAEELIRTYRGISMDTCTGALAEEISRIWQVGVKEIALSALMSLLCVPYIPQQKTRANVRVCACRVSASLRVCMWPFVCNHLRKRGKTHANMGCMRNMRICKTERGHARSTLTTHATGVACFARAHQAPRPWHRRWEDSKSAMWQLTCADGD